MPISDEIIELAPIKKTKTTLIIMFVIMGVLLAAAAAFLVLYLLKPSAVVGEGVGTVEGVEITESTTLFSTTDENGAPILTASVGSSYTVYATINVKGDPSTEIKWNIDCDGERVSTPTKVFADFKYGLADSKDVANAERDAESGNTRYTYFCTFTPNAASAGKEITLSAVSQEQTTKSDNITFTVVEQHTKFVFFTDYSGKTTNDRKVSLTSSTLTLPCYSSSTNNLPYLIYISQKGASGVKNGEYAEITVNEDTKSDDVRVVSSKPDIVEVGEYSRSLSRFQVKVKAAGTADITVTANINNVSDDVTQVLHIVARSSTDLGIVDAIYFTDKPVDAEFFSANWANKVPQSTSKINITSTLTLPYSEVGSYSDVLKHIVLVPYTLQCTRTMDGTTPKYELKNGWQDQIRITSSNDSICKPTQTSNSQLGYRNWTLPCRNLSAGDQCKLSITDTSAGAIAKACDINLNVVAPSSKVEMSFKLGETTKSDKDITDSNDESKPANAIPISQSQEATLTVSYEFRAPANTDVSTMVENGYVSTGYMMTVSDSKFMTVKLKTATVKLATSQQFADNSLDAINKFDKNNFEIAKKQNQTVWYVGTATFSLTVGNSTDVKNNFYTLTFKKIGVGTSNDPDIERPIRFIVTAVATKAEFEDADIINDIIENEIITQKGIDCKFVRGANLTSGEALGKIYIQNQVNNTKLTDIIDFTKLFKVDQGSLRLKGSITQKTDETFRGSNSYENLQFLGVDPNAGYGLTSAQARITFTAEAEGTTNTEIGKFVVEIYVFNAIQSIQCNYTAVDTKDYTKDKDNYSSSLQFSLDVITAERTSPNRRTDLQPSDFTFKLMYYSGNQYRYFDERQKPGDSSAVQYGILVDGAFNEVFEYKDRNIYAIDDPFLVAFNCGVTISSIRVEYKNKPSSLYNQAVTSCYRTYSLIRQADDFAIFADSLYQTKVSGNSSTGFSISLNQNDPGALYASAIVKNGDDDIIVSRYTVNEISTCETVFLTVPPSNALSSLTGAEYVNPDIANAYTSIAFRAPVISGKQLVLSDIKVQRYYDRSPKDVVITVNNAARPIKKIGLYEADEDGKDTSTPLTSLVFGKFKPVATSPYTKTFYVVIEYDVASPGNYVYFETADLSMRSYLRLSLDDAAYNTVADKYTIGQEIVTRNEGGVLKSNIDDNNVIYKVKCTVELIPEASQYRNGNDAIDSIALNCSSVATAAKASVRIATGIDYVSYTVDDDVVSSKNNNIKDVNIVLSNATDAKHVEIPFSIKTYADEVGSDYAYDAEKKCGIAYNLSDIEITGPTDIDGLKFGKSTSAGDTHFAFIIDVNKIRNIAKTQVTVTFIDKASGSAAQTIQILFNISVETDIYALDIGNHSFTTNGKSDNQPAQNVSIKYNGESPLLQPSADRIKDLTAAIYTRNGNSYTEYNEGDVTVSGANGAFTLTVKNTVLTNYIVNASGQKEYFYLGLTYGDKTYYTQSPISITTTSEEIALVGGESNLNVTDAVVNGVVGNVRVNVTSPSDTFNIAAYVFNRGTLAKASTAVTYKMYASASDRANDSNALTGNDAIAVIDGNGTFKIINPHKAEADRTVYYRAYFTDPGRNVLRYIDVNIDYTVSIATVTIEGIEGGILNGNTITLYYLAAGAYTQIDLTDFIKVKTAFGDDVDIPAGTTITLTSKNTARLTANGMKLYPAGSNASLVDFEIKASDGIVDPITNTYSVLIRTLTSPTLTAANGATSINVVLNESVGVSVGNVSDYSGLKYEYTVDYDGDMFDVQTGEGNSFTVSAKRDYAFKVSDYASSKSYTFTVKVKYLNDNSSATVVGGNDFAVSKAISLSLDWSGYTPKFEVVDDSNNVIGKSDESGNVSVAYDSAVKYYIRLVKPASTVAWYEDSDWTYTAVDNNHVVTVGAFDSDNRAEITFGSAYGATNLTLTATAYGKNVSVGKSVTFNYGDNTVATISMSDDGGTTYKPIELTNNSANIAIDFGTPIAGGTAVAARKFRYDIDATGVGDTVNASDIKIMHSGDVTVGAIQSSGANKFYVIITANDVTKLTVSSTITVSGRMYYKDVITLNLTATKPSITATVTSPEIVPSATTQFGVTLDDNGFIGNYEASYAIIDGSDVATISTSGVLTPKRNNTQDRRVVVAITVKIKDGVYKDAEYTVEKAAVIKGIPLPEIVIKDAANWRNSATTIVANGVAVDYRNMFDLSEVVVEDQTYKFNATYAFSITAPNGAGFTSADYTAQNSTLAVNNTDNVRAGGRFTLTVTATIGGSINTNSTVSRDFYIDVIPAVKVVDSMSVSARKGSYNIKDAVELYTGSGEGQITADAVYTVSYTLQNGNDGLNGEKISDFVSVSGSVITLKKSMPYAGITVNLSPVVTVHSGTYAGVSFAGHDVVTVAINGFTIAPMSVTWNTDPEVNAYPAVNVADLLAGLNIEGTPTIEVRALTHVPQVTITGNGTADPEISVDKAINVQSAINAPAENVEFEFIISVGDTEYYALGSLAVNAIVPSVTVTLNPTASIDDADNKYHVGIMSGSTLNISIEESHGLYVTDISNSDLGDILSSVVSGTNILVTAADIADPVSKDVTLTYYVSGIAGSYEFVVDISPRGDDPTAFVVTNENVVIARSSEWVTYRTDKYYGFVSEWTASSSNQYTVPNSLYIRPSGFNYCTNLLAYVKVEAFDANGNSVGNSIENYWGTTPRNLSVTLSLSSITAEAYRVKFTFGLRSDSIKQFTVQYQSKKRGTSDTITTSKVYKWSFSDTVKVTMDTNATDVSCAPDININCIYGYDALPADLARSGYRFGGWYLDKPCTISVGTRTTVIGCSHTVYAKWTPLDYDVTFNANGGIVNGQNETKIKETYDEKYTLPAEPSRVVYYFAGWYTTSNATGGNSVTTDTTVRVDADQTTLYARWMARTYTVTFDDSAIDAFYRERTVTYDSKYGSLPVPTKTGYTFGGWYTSATNQTEQTEITSDSDVVTARDHSLYAKWTKQTYTVKFFANGGTLTTDSIQVTFGGKYATSAFETPTRTGYEFKGWYSDLFTQDSTTLVTYQSNVTIAADHVLYAKWETKTYTVTLSASGATIKKGNNNITQITVDYGGTYAELDELTVEKSGYTFGGWYTSSTNQTDTTKITSSSNVVTTTNQTLYAKWTPQTYTVKFFANGGTLTTDSIQVTFGGKYATSAFETPTRTGYEFKGWYSDLFTQDNTTLVTYQSNVTIAADHVLYAKWEAKTFEITLNAPGATIKKDGATVSNNKITVTYDDTYAALDGIIAEKTGYTFVGWKDGVGNIITKDAKVTITAPAPLTAVLRANTYTVTLKNDNNTVVTTITVTYDGDYSALNDVALTKAGYDLVWKHDGVTIDSTDKVEITDNAEFVAEWVAKNYTVTLDGGNGATVKKDGVAVTSIIVIFGGTYAELADVTAEKTGYNFVGWKYNGATVNATDTVAITSDVVFTAEWEAKTFEITLTADGATVKKDGVAVTSITVTYNEPCAELGELTVQKTGYTFIGWKYGDATVSSSTIIALTEDAEFTAEFEAIEYTVRFYANGGTLEETSITVTYGEAYSEDAFVAPARDGYTFAGWYTDPFTQDETTLVTNETIVDIAADHILYAKWEAAEESGEEA